MAEPSRRPSSTTPKPSHFIRSASRDRSRLGQRKIMGLDVLADRWRVEPAS
jgi:hypothetical protein